MVTHARSIVPALLVSAAAAAAVTVTSAATATTPRAGGCVTPRLVGLTERAAARRARAAGCGVHLAGDRLKQASVQTVAVQDPAPGTRSVVVRLRLNPLCFAPALSGPPHDQGRQPGPTELITGLYLVGGPALPYSSPGCKRTPSMAAHPAPGTIDVFDAAGGKLVASRTAKRGKLVTFRLAPGRYRIGAAATGAPSPAGPGPGPDTDTDTDTGSAGPGAQAFARPLTIRAGYTTRRYVIEPVP